MINVTKENYWDSLGQICSQIESCDLTAFDFEMTGLTSKDYRTSPFDTLEDRYDRHREDVSFCMPNQVLISPSVILTGFSVWPGSVHV